MAELKFLDYEGLSTYTELIKTYIDDEDAKSIKSVSLSRNGNEIYFYTIENPGFGSSPAYTIELPDFDTSDLMKLVQGAIEGDIAVYDSDGQVIDSETSLANMIEAIEAAQKAADDITEYVGTIPEGYSADTVVGYVKEVTDNIIANGYDDTELRAAVEANKEAIDTLNGDEDTDGSVAKQVNDVKEELTEAITTAVANAGHLKKEIVDELPDVAEADELTIYMVLKQNGSGDNIYDEYMVIAGAWEKIGDTEVDLTNYAKIEYVDEQVLSAVSTAEGYADTQVSALENGQVAENKSAIESLQDAVDDISAIPIEDITALFN